MLLDLRDSDVKLESDGREKNPPIRHLYFEPCRQIAARKACAAICLGVRRMAKNAITVPDEPKTVFPFQRCHFLLHVSLLSPNSEKLKEKQSNLDGIYLGTMQE